jgi:outer membrane protein TolC
VQLTPDWWHPNIIRLGADELDCIEREFHLTRIHTSLLNRRYRVALGIGLMFASALAGQQSQFEGSVPTGTASSTPLALTLHDAIDRGLKANLGLLVSGSASEIARGQRLRALSALMPQVGGQVSETVEQLNLKTIGFTFSIPGAALPTIVGPFQFTDLRASASLTVFDYNKWKNYRSSRESQRAAQLSYQDARDLVVQAVANAYLQVTADASRTEAIRAQVTTDQALYDRTVDQKKAGTSPGIDVLRSQVELKQQQQRLLAQENQLAKDKLSLGRVIGLPIGQDFNIAETTPYSPLASITQEQALRTALEQRPDYQSAKAQVRAAEDTVRATRAERYPTVGVTGDYGDVGPTIGESHGTFTFVASLKFNIFDGGRIGSDEIQAKATLKQRQDELADLGGQIDYQVRAAFLDIQSAADQVAVAKSNLELANQTLEQARDRFTAGVTDNIEVVQAQQSVASANDNLIFALYAHNLAKVALARALGAAEQGIQKFMEVK